MLRLVPSTQKMDGRKFYMILPSRNHSFTMPWHSSAMKTVSGLLVALTSPLWAHPDHAPSVHGEDLDLEKAHRSPGEENAVTIEEIGEFRVVRANGIPDHDTGRFPNRDNPNAIREQDYRFRMPLEPEAANAPVKLEHQLFGVALNGVVFDPQTAEYYRNDRESEWNYEALSGELDLGLDEHHAHVQPNGAYHYHGLPTGLFERLSGGEKKMTLIGWAADGYPIYGLYGFSDPNDAESDVVELKSSYKLKEGKRRGAGTPRGEYDGTFTMDYEYEEGLGDLDECNGREGVTPEFPEGTYHYVLTADYPFIPRIFHGTPDPSFSKQLGPEMTGPPGEDGHPPHGPPHGPHGPHPHGPPPRR